MSSINKCAFTYLADVGYFVDPFQVNVLEQNVLPWLFSQVETFVADMGIQHDFSDILVGSNVDAQMLEHEKTVQGERDRKEAVRLGIEEA